MFVIIHIAQAKSRTFFPKSSQKESPFNARNGLASDWGYGNGLTILWASRRRFDCPNLDANYFSDSAQGI